MNYDEHNPPHFHVEYGDYKCIIGINDIEKLKGNMPNKQLKMNLGWAALHQEELIEEWELAMNGHELFPIEPLR